MNVEIGTEAGQFPENEYINGTAVAVWLLKADLEQPANLYLGKGTVAPD
jgi:hypothetical protein